MALDNTGSMASSGKMTALRTASLEMVTILENSGRRAGDIRIGLVPFNTVVRVNASTYSSASWIRDVPGNGNGNGWGWGWGNGNGNSWEGCIQDRDLPYNTNDTAPTSNATRFPAVDCDLNSQSLARVQPLTTDFSAVRSTINAMTPVGNTNVTIGVAGLAPVVGRRALHADAVDERDQCRPLADRAHRRR